MKTLQRRIEKLEQAEPDDENLTFEVTYIDPETKLGTLRTVFHGGGGHTDYEPDGNGGWRQTNETP